MADSATRARPGGRSARVQAAVLDATLDELTDHGYDALSIAKVATRAGVHKTAVYRRWPSKGSLLAAALLDGSTELAFPDTGSLVGDLLALNITGPQADTTPDRLARGIAVTRALDAAGADPDVAKARSVLWDRRLAVVRHAVEQAKDRGEIAAEVDADLILDVIFGAFHTRVVARGEPFTPEFGRKVLGLFLQ
jgi:AcrR family transcriptional regulator